MALDRWIAMIILGVSLAYGYAAFFTMDHLLPPFMQRNPIWPSTFPKVIATMSVCCSLVILLGLEKPGPSNDPAQNTRVWETFERPQILQALALLGLMVAYALLLRPIGFLLATAGFLIAGSAILGERRWLIMLLVSAIATGVVWYLVQVVLGIYLKPLPFGLEV